MTLPITIYAAMPMDPQSLAQFVKLEDAGKYVPPPALRFHLGRRMVVGYLCTQCVNEGINPDYCRSPEWEWTEQNIREGIPEEVVMWTERHARDHARLASVREERFLR